MILRRVAALGVCLGALGAFGAVGMDPAAAGAAGDTVCVARRVYRAAPAQVPGAIAFADATAKWGADEPLRGMLAHATAVGDVNRDGWTDLFVGTFADRPEADYRVRGADAAAPDRLLLGGPGGFHVAADFPGTRGRTSGAAFADLDGDGWLDLVIARNVMDGDGGRAPTEILRNQGDGRLVRAATLPEPRGARSVGLVDYDRDGRTDLFVTEDRWTGGSSRLLRNLGGLRFADVTAAAGLPDHLVGMGVATADLNGDGAPDLFVGGGNRLFVNDGAGHFHEGASSTFRWRTFGTEDDPAGVAVGDLDRDGRADLVVGQHYGSTLEFGRRVPVRVYLNTGDDAAGDPGFRDVTDAAGLVGVPTKAPHVEIADFDADGWPDILTSASVDAVTPLVFRNLGPDGGIPRFAGNAAPGPSQYWPSGAVLDADHDGRLDVVLAEFDAGRPTLVLRNVTGSGHWLAVEARPGTRLTVRAATRSDRDAPLASATVDGATGFGGGAGPVAWFGVGDATAVDVEGHTAAGRAFRLADLAVDRLVSLRGCAGADVSPT